MTEKLKPCPFCGGRAKIHQAYDGYFQIECENCGARSQLSEFEDITKTLWNRRQTMPNKLTPEAAIIRLNQFRTDKGERPPEIDMAITAINRQFIKRKTAIGGLNGRCCPSCGSQLIDEYCGHCGQALDWGE